MNHLMSTFNALVLKSLSDPIQSDSKLLSAHYLMRYTLRTFVGYLTSDSGFLTLPITIISVYPKIVCINCLINI